MQLNLLVRDVGFSFASGFRVLQAASGVHTALFRALGVWALGFQDSGTLGGHLTASDVLWRSLNSYIANQAHGCASESYSPAQVSSTVQYGGIKLAPLELPPVNATLATAALVMGLYASGIVLQKLNSLSISMLAKWPAYFEVLLPKAVFPTC